QVALRHPDRGAVADRLELPEAVGGLGQRSLGLVESILLDQRAAQDELRAADRVEEVDAAVEETQRLPGVLLGELDLAATEMDAVAGGSPRPCASSRARSTSSRAAAKSRWRR